MIPVIRSSSSMGFADERRSTATRHSVSPRMHQVASVLPTRTSFEDCLKTHFA